MKREAALYETLEVSPHASAWVIKAAYRCLAQRNHPDKNPGNAAAGEKLAEINHAYAVLSDPDKRRVYDQTIALHEPAVERRGSGMSAGDGASPAVADHPVSRAFVFRPLT